MLLRSTEAVSPTDSFESGSRLIGSPNATRSFTGPNGALDQAEDLEAQVPSTGGREASDLSAMVITSGWETRDTHHS